MIQPRPEGRPPPTDTAGESPILGLRVSPAGMEAIEKAAAALGVSRSDFVRQAIEKALA